MDIEQVAPELREIVGMMPAMPYDSEEGLRQIRLSISERPPVALSGARLECLNEHGLSLRLFHPDAQRSDAALLWFHGGGYIIGLPQQNDAFCARIAQTLGILVVSASYRLAPENPFPAALDDALAAWRWVHREAGRLRIDPARIAVGGQSAGGGLAAGLIQRIHDGDGPNAAAQLLFCPMIDDRTAADRKLDAAANFVWNNNYNAIGWSAYLAQEAGAAEVPPYAAASRRADLSGLPPAWIGVGDIDLFHAEGRIYADRLEASGVAVTFDLVAGAPHGFESWAPDTPIARSFVDRAIAWLGTQLG